MARLKAEWEQHVHDARGVPWRTRLVAATAPLLRWASVAPWAYNLAVGAPGASWLVKRLLGFAPGRSLPALSPQRLSRWFARRRPRWSPATAPRGAVHLLCDEFTDTLDAPVGIAAVELLEALGYAVVIAPHADSGRAQLSKGLVRAARDLAVKNVTALDGVVNDRMPLVGLEPSALLSFRDEYPDLVPAGLVEPARRLAGRALLLEEFLAREAAAGRISAADFDNQPRAIALHGHCHQKALSSMEPAVAALALPAGHAVSVIPSGCCGMAGSFGYDRGHFAVSMAIGELVLLPAVRALPADTLVAAAGTSCRHQIADGTGRRALHPAEILRAAVRGG